MILTVLSHLNVTGGLKYALNKIKWTGYTNGSTTKPVTTSIIYVTVGDQNEADLIASKIVEERLASSVNIVDSVRSYYWWSSTVQRQEEFLLIAKTRTAIVDAAIERIRDIHSYECPCIVSWPIEKGNKDYLEWIGRETEGTGIR